MHRRAAQQAGASAKKALQALSDTITAKEDALKAIGDKQTTATQAVDTARDKALKQVKASTEAAQTAANEAATSGGQCRPERTAGRWQPASPQGTALPLATSKASPAMTVSPQL